MKIVLSELAHKKIKHWVDKADFEVSGFGKVHYYKEEDCFFVLDAYLVKQEGSGAATEIDQTALGQLMFKTKDIPGLLNFWWHSHVNMSVFWSGTDTDTIKELGAQGLCVATVFNKKGEMHSAVCAKMTGMFGDKVTFWDDVKTEIDSETPEEVLAQWDKEFDDTVTRKKYHTTTSTYENWEWEKDENGVWTRKEKSKEDEKEIKLVTSTQNHTSSTSGERFGPEGIHNFWVKKEAELVDMSPKDYWEKSNTENWEAYEDLEALLEAKAWEKHGVSYNTWANDMYKERRGQSGQWNT